MIETVEDYLSEYAVELSLKIDTVFEPLHRRGERSVPIAKINRKLIGGQDDAVQALVMAMRSGEKACNLIGQLGTGKTCCSAVAIHTHAAGRSYRSVVVCPPHLTEKWVRELEAVIPDVKARIVHRYHDLTRLAVAREEPVGAEWFVVSSSMAKLLPEWKPAYTTRGKLKLLHCPACDAPAFKKDEEGDVVPMVVSDLERGRMPCVSCGQPLWTWTKGMKRWPIAKFIQRKMKGMFKYFVLDEAHEAAGVDSEIAIAVSQLVQAVDHVLELTGTYLNGYAESIMHLMWRSSPATLHEMGYKYGQTNAFSEKYGRFERTVKVRLATDHKKAGKGRTKTKVKPGIMPTLFGDHLLGKSVFLSLADISDDLPKLESSVVPVSMDAELWEEYKRIQTAVAMGMKIAMDRKDMAMLSRMVHLLIGYPDHPYGWEPIGFSDGGKFMPVVIPRDLSRRTLRPKEEALIDAIASEANEGRKTWVFCEMTQTRDVQPRLQSLLEEMGMRVAVLKSQSVATVKREEWIARNGPYCDVIISNPRLVSVGLDFFERSPYGGYRYNFPTLAFWQTPLSTATQRQASGRSYRLGQSETCKILHFHYQACMETRLVNLMAAKVQASEAIDGKFSVDGLTALSESGDSMGLALARSLLETMGIKVAKSSNLVVRI